MNLEIVRVELLAIDGDKDCLRFYIPETPLDVNLNSSSCQNSLKLVFSELVKKMIHTDFELKLEINPEYSRTMYKEICEEYIKDLNRELDEVKGEVRKELGGTIPQLK